MGRGKVLIMLNKYIVIIIALSLGLSSYIHADTIHYICVSEKIISNNKQEILPITKREKFKLDMQTEWYGKPTSLINHTNKRIEISKNTQTKLEWFQSNTNNFKMTTRSVFYKNKIFVYEIKISKNKPISIQIKVTALINDTVTNTGIVIGSCIEKGEK